MNPAVMYLDHSARTEARRHRQVAEIAAMVSAGRRERAAGLAALHLAEFGDDAEMVAQITAPSEGAAVKP